MAAEHGLGHVEESLLNDCGAESLARPAPKRAQFGDEPADRAVGLGRCGAEGHARDRLPRRKGEQNGLRLEPVQRRPGVEEILPILPIRPVMDLDQQSAPEARDPDRGRQMIDGRGGDNGEPDRREAGRFRRAQPGESAIELNRLQKPEPMAGQRRQAFEPLAGLGSPSAAPRSPRKSAATGSQLIVGLRGEAVCGIRRARSGEAS